MINNFLSPVQNLWFVYQNFKIWLKTPTCSVECCVALLLSILQFVGGFLGASSADVIKEQVVVGEVDAPTIENQVTSQIAFEVEADTQEQDEKKDGKQETLKEYVTINVSPLMRSRIWLQNIAKRRRKKLTKSSDSSQLETLRFDHTLLQNIKTLKPNLKEIEKVENRHTPLRIMVMPVS